MPMALPLLLALAAAAVLLPLASPAASPPPLANFSLDFFPGVAARAVAHLALSGGASATSSGAVSMPTPAAQVQYRDPIVFSSSAPLTFSTHFSFAAPSLAFFLTPSAAASPPALAVVFSTRHIRLDLAGRTVLQARSHPHSPAAATGRQPHSSSSIDYNATSATLHVRLSNAARLPTPPLLSYPLDLSLLLGRGPVLAGFRASSGNCSLFSWAFRASPYRMPRMHSQPLNPADLLTTPPPHRVHGARARGWGPAVSLLFAAACGAMVTLFVLFLCYSVATRRPVAPVEYPMHPSGVVYEKIVLVGVKADDDVGHPPSPSGAITTK